MSDQPTPLQIGFRPQPSPPERPAPEPLWSVTRADGVTVSCRLLWRGRWGVETQIFIAGDLLIAHLFPERALADMWVASERIAAERHGQIR